MGYGRPLVKRAVFVACAVLALILPGEAFARYDPSWEWCTVSTDGFVIYYPKGHEPLAQRVLSLCKEVRPDVTGYLGVEPRTCPIVLNPGTDVFNGYMDVFPSKISLFETPLYTVRGFGPGSDLMDLVFTHEYTHYVHITTKLGWYGTLTDVIGDGLAVSNAVSPGWVVEGATTNTETMFTDGGRGRSPFFKGEMMSFTDGGELWGLNAAAVSSPYSPPGSRIYLAGYFMVDYLDRTKGKDAFPRLGRYQAEHPLGGTKEALMEVAGEYPDQFYFAFLRDFEAQAKAQKEKAAASPLPAGRAVLAEKSGLGGYPWHFWTKSGTLLGFRSSYDHATALVEIDPATEKTIAETDTGVMTNIWAKRLPDGRLALAEVEYHPLGDGQMDTTDLVLFDPATKTRERITRGEHIYSASLSPDGSTFVATRRNGMWIELVLMDADGKNIRPLVSKPGYYFDSPCWSPDGKRIAAVAKGGRNADIVLVSPATGSMELLFASDAAEDNDPEFSPDGSWLVFSSDRSGTWNIYAWSIEGRRLHQLTSVSWVATAPHVSPDGKTLSFASMARGVDQVCITPFDPAGGTQVKVAGPASLPQPDLARLQPAVEFTGTKGIPLSAYKPFAHVPYLSSDEEGTQAGVFIMGADPVGITSYTANLLYGFGSKRAGYDLSVVNKSFWPTIQGRIYDIPLEDDALGGGDSYWYRERGGELSLGLSPILQVTPSTVTASFRAGPRVRYFSSLDDDIHVDEESNQSMALFGELTLARRPDSAARDMVPGWGEDVFASYEKSFSALGGDMPGHNAVVSLTQYVPSPVKHQGFALTVVHQSQQGDLSYDKDLSIPRGYSDDDHEGDLDADKNLLLRAEYHAPLLFTDGGLGLYLFHSDLVKGSLFVDYGAGWDGGFDWGDWNAKARTSLGATLTDKCVILAVLPLEVGLEFGYKTHEHEGFLNFILRLPL